MSANPGSPSTPRLAGQPQPQLHSPRPDPQARQTGWAIVGLGKLTQGEILPAFAETQHCRLAALVSGNPDKARDVAARWGVPGTSLYSYEDFDRIAQDPSIDIVYIVTPNALHKDLTMRALKAGKHVLCEKPMEVTVEACEAMIAAAREAKRLLMIAYREQYEPHNLAAVRAIRAGEIGAVRLIVTDTGRPADPADPADQWRLKRALAGGGSLMDIGIYGLNGARYLAGEEPVEVRAQIFNPPGDPRFAEVEDVVAWQLRFASGALANGSTSYSYFKANRFAVLGASGGLYMEPATAYDEHSLTIRTSEGERKPSIHEINQFAAEMDHLAEAALHGAPVNSPGEEGLQDVRLMLAIYEAARTGAPVSTDWGYQRATPLQ